VKTRRSFNCFQIPRARKNSDIWREQKRGSGLTAFVVQFQGCATEIVHGRSAPFAGDAGGAVFYPPKEVAARPALCHAREMVTLVIATRNQHKVQEIRAILGDTAKCASLAEFPNAPAVIEDAPTFAGNATKKAVTLARWLSGQAGGERVADFVLADDSGLEVDALAGAPGVHSARFAALDKASNSPDADNNAKLMRLLADVPAEKRAARFRCVLALTPVADVPAVNASPVCAADEFELATELFDGTCEGRMAFATSGGGGFGYDPLFVPDGFEQSFAELGEDAKNRISHRAKALAKLRERLQKRPLK
jgi:XTP/dITP diphosphohydrolase